LFHVPTSPRKSIAAYVADRDRDLERVREASDIVRVIGEHMTLKPKGREFVGLCPFHDDHKPSMSVVPSKQFFHCFVCQTGGDVFKFIQLFHKMEFPEAVRYLAERAGIELAKFSSRQPEGEADESGWASRRQLFDATALAGEFFRAIYAHAEHGQVAREIVARRGISDAMVAHFAIGSSPDRWDGLALTLQHKRTSTTLDHLTQAGLLKRRDEGGYYDVLRHRLIFPIHETTGRIVGFGGRKIRDEDEPKYLNSPETPIFQKSSTLYGLYQAAASIKKTRTAIITEGYTDTIACHQAGFTHAVATLGTALTPGHARILERLCETVVLLFDGDSAGQRAAQRAVEILFSANLDVRIATLAGITDAKDPDELLKREGGGVLLQQAINHATPLLAYRYARVRETIKGPALVRAFDEEAETLARLGYHELPPEKRRVIQRELASTWGVTEADIAARLRAKAARLAPRALASSDVIEPKLSATPTEAEIIIGCLLNDEATWAELPEAERRALDQFDPQTPGGRIASMMIQLIDSQARCDLRSLLERLDEPDQARARQLESWVRVQCEGQPARIDRLRQDCLQSMAKLSASGLGASANAQPVDAAEQRLRLLREQHRAFGPDRARMPRLAPP
jgi:DNA primase